MIRHGHDVLFRPSAVATSSTGPGSISVNTRSNGYSFSIPSFLVSRLNTFALAGRHIPFPVFRRSREGEHVGKADDVEDLPNDRADPDQDHAAARSGHLLVRGEEDPQSGGRDVIHVGEVKDHLLDAVERDGGGLTLDEIRELLG